MAYSEDEVDCVHSDDFLCHDSVPWAYGIW